MTDNSQPNKSTVLIVDDTPENLTVLGQLLQPYYRIKVANSGPRALVIAQTNPKPDLILLDVMMPDMDGYTVLIRLTENPDTADIPVMFVTALENTEDEAHGLDLGAVDYIAKPIRPAIVLSRIRGQLELKAARDLMRNQNAWLENEVACRIMQVKHMRDITIRALASIAETRDNETGNHILRTQAYVALLCEQLVKSGYHLDELSPEKIELITKAAPLHDMGKVGIPDHILLKPGQLTNDEFTIMKTHAMLGSNAIWRAIQHEQDQSDLDFLHVAIEIAHYHHEKWDGSGYPEGLSGTNIPLSARLMALADVFDALMNKRVYKPAFSFDHAIAIIEADKEKHFDPSIVDAFLARQDDFKAIADQYIDHPL